jgi:predicted methyltransferase
VLLLALLALALGCSPAETNEPAATPPAASAADPAPGADLEALAARAVAHEGRSEADRADDAGRKPAAVVAFLGIEPGMTVLDLLAGGGYYSEILAHVVGDEGVVLAQNNSLYIGFVGEAFAERLADDRLPNVERIDSEVLELELEPASIDAAVFVLGYHDIYFRPEDGGWEELTPELVLAKLFAALKPGGVLGIVDHAALPGADLADTANALHRIDEDVARAQIEAAGFVLEATSDVLRSAEDERTISVFDDSIRRRTDRFVHRYRKPS